MPDTSALIPSMELYGGEAAPLALHGERLRDRAGPHGWTIRPHRHPGLMQVFVILSGQAGIAIDGARLTPDLPALVVVPPLVVHGFDFAPGTEGFVLTLPAGQVSELQAPAGPAVPGLDRWACLPVPAGLPGLCEQVAAETARPDAHSPAMLRGLALQLLAGIARARPAGSGPRAAGRAAVHMASFEAQIRSRLRDGWTVADHARALGLSATHLTRICLAHAGQPPGQLIAARRMQEARRLLAYSTLSVAEVGYALGIEDPAYFSRAFRRAVGESPGAFRRRAAGTDLPQG